jgi:hypothetical protein
MEQNSSQKRRTQRDRLARPGTQKGRILRRLIADYPNWTSTAIVHRPDSGPAIIQAGTRLWELEHDHGIAVENRLRRVNGVAHSDYRLVSWPVAQPRLQTSPTYAELLFDDLAPESRYPD